MTLLRLVPVATLRSVSICVYLWLIALLFSPLPAFSQAGEGERPREPILPHNSSAPSKPNLIFVLLDDVSAKEFTCYGGRGIQTPTLDRMAREGVMFRTAWSSPVCGPSRAMLHTGRYGERTHHLDNDIMPRRPFWLQNQVLGKVLQSAGYTTGMFGKSHFSNNPRADLGFDEYCIARYWPGYNGPPQAANTKATASMYAIQWYWHPGLIADGKGLPTRPDDFGPDLEVERIRQFIGRHKAQPFFVYYPINLPHMTVQSTNSPTGPGARWSYTDVPERDSQGHPTGQRIPGSLKSNLEYADYLVAQIWAKVAGEGLSQNTILMIAGDNGTAGYGKARLNSEVALRVPFVVYGPGRLKLTGPSDVLVDFSDILPTLADLARAPLPKDYALDGHSFAPLLLGQPFIAREWIHGFLGTARWLRDPRWLLDGTGRFYDCGTNRNETLGYRDVTASIAPDVVAARSRFDAILKTLPVADTNDPVIGPALKRFDEQRKGGKAAAPASARRDNSSLPASFRPRPLVGAIRWDGWFKDNPWEKNLQAAEWRSRLPFFAQVDKAGKVTICGDAQSVMDQEIGYAKAGGLDYWAFCYYHGGSNAPLAAYNYGWTRYLASQHKTNLNFCLLLQGPHLGPTNEWDATVRQFVGLFKEPTYQRVLEGRPLLYVYSGEKVIPHFGSAAAAREAFACLRVASEAAGAGKPYIVAQIWPHQTHADFLNTLGFDALGAYSAQGHTNAALPYARLVQMNRWYWNQFKDTGREVVPLVNAGWDGRPRQYSGAWYEPAKPEEIADAVRGAMNWMRANASTTPANTLLIYAWNEYDEGGWLCPTINPDGTTNPDRLTALGNLLRRANIPLRSNALNSPRQQKLPVQR